jgi:hypothetical protein
VTLPRANRQYAAVCTRPDVSTALSILGSAQAHPTEVHLQATKNVVRYLKGTLHLRLTFGEGEDRPQPPTHMLRRRRLGE